MATWTNGVRSAQKMIEDVEMCLSENCTHFREITLYPFRSNGGRSNGVTAIFEYQQGNKKNHVSISVYEHWTSDNICVKVSDWVPTNMSEGHDEPSAEFRQNESDCVCYAIQSFLCQFFNIPFPKEWYVPMGFKGFGTFDDDKKMDYADDKMMPTIIDWCDPPEEDNG